MAQRQRGWLEPEDLSFAAMPAVVRARSDDARPVPVPMTAVDPAEERRVLARQLAARPSGVTRGQLARAAGVSGNTAWKILTALIADGTLGCVGAGRAVRYVIR
jgi:hypothetical protein